MTWNLHIQHTDVGEPAGENLFVHVFTSASIHHCGKKDCGHKEEESHDIVYVSFKAHYPVIGYLA